MSKLLSSEIEKLVIILVFSELQHQLSIVQLKMVTQNTQVAMPNQLQDNKHHFYNLIHYQFKIFTQKSCFHFLALPNISLTYKSLSTNVQPPP